jgi:hypothetical protein
MGATSERLQAQVQQDPNAMTGDMAMPIVVQEHKNPVKKFLYSHWTDQAARTTALLAVLAAVASSQYALQISRAILSQAEASDEWNYYSAKSIKKHLTAQEGVTLKALVLANPVMKDQLQPLIDSSQKEVDKYDHETKELQQSATSISEQKKRHQRQGDRFQYAFVLLQAGVVLCTVASSSRKKFLWLMAVVCGAAGLLMLGNGYVLLF